MGLSEEGNGYGRHEDSVIQFKVCGKQVWGLRGHWTGKGLWHVRGLSDETLQCLEYVRRLSVGRSGEGNGYGGREIRESGLDLRLCESPP